MKFNRKRRFATGVNLKALPLSAPSCIKIGAKMQASYNSSDGNKIQGEWEAHQSFQL